jgi:cell division septation protein DedD
MSQSYYVIELSARWLTVLLVALAVIMVLAFALGYGAAWSVLSSERHGPSSMTALAAAATPTSIPEIVIPTPEAAAENTPTPLPVPTATPTAEPTRVPTPRSTPTATASDFYVQVLASSRSDAVEAARAKLVDLGFPRDNQRVMTGDGGATLFKLQVGPFPDRSSADRVAQRMSAAGFPDAWVVAP